MERRMKESLSSSCMGAGSKGGTGAYKACLESLDTLRLEKNLKTNICPTI